MAVGLRRSGNGPATSLRQIYKTALGSAVVGRPRWTIWVHITVTPLSQISASRPSAGHYWPTRLVMEHFLPFAAPQPMLEPHHSSADALHILIKALALTFQNHLQVIKTEDDAEPVHKARVTLRRLRAAIAVFSPMIDEDLAEAMQDSARRLFRVLGAVRDADVMAARFAGTHRAETLARNALTQRQKARKALKKIKADGFAPWVLKRLDGKGWPRTGKKAKVLRDAPVANLAALALDRAWQAALSNGADLTRMTPRAQHELRKDLKMLRYQSEFFVKIWPAAPHERFLAPLRDLQDDLGEVTDLELARAFGQVKGDDSTAEAQRAAQHWVALQSIGPWWTPV